MNELQDAYSSALRSYVADGSEYALIQLGELGNTAVADDFPIESIAELHQEALRHVTFADLDSQLSQERVGSCLAAFMMSYGLSYRERSERARSLMIADAAQRQKLHALGQLAAGVAHELNNLLQPVTGLCELQLEETLPTDLTQSFETILDCSRKGAAIVRHILTYVRQMTPRMEVMTLATAVSDEIEFLRRTLPFGVELKACIDAAGVTVLGSRSELAQIIHNLVLNAADAMDGVGAVTVSTFSRGDDHVGLSVSDTGRGITRDVQRRIFEPFFTTKAPGKGTGLGLAVVQSIVAAWNGSIEVESEAGRGTTIMIALPVAQEPTAAAV